jgi:D-glycero-alpha-D-manno-heptose-7-phosphate kinase
MRILSIAPSRIGLFGGGTDTPEYAESKGGLVVSMAINLYTKTTLYSDGDEYGIENKFPFNASPDFYYQILDEYGINGMHHSKLRNEFDGLIESGLGSSASAAVALIGAIDRRLKLNLTPEQIAEKAWEIETNKIKHFGGKQDQYAAALGGVNVMEFKDKVSVVPLAKKFIEPLFPSLVLFHTGIKRKSSETQEGFKKLSQKQIDSLDNVKALAVEAIDYIASGDYKTVGEIMDEAWMYKKESNKGVSTPEIDNLYKKGLKLGAIGGKLMGSGGGGYFLFVVPPDKKQYLIDNMSIEWQDFSVSWNGVETRIL